MLEGKDKLIKVKREICPHDDLIEFDKESLECSTCGLLLPRAVFKPCRYCDGTVVISLLSKEATCSDCGEDYCPSEFGF